MEDKDIVALFWCRSEQAIEETDKKYGAYCYRIAYNILSDIEESEECINDTYFSAWNTIPPQRPSILSAFLAKITRNLSIDRWRKKSAAKRGGGQLAVALEELEGQLCASDTAESLVMQKELRQVINQLLDELPQMERVIFLRRYWYLNSVPEIAAHFGYSQSKVNSILYRTRAKLRKQLAKEGIP